MIRIEQFINTMHRAVLVANETLMKENLKLLDTYFEASDETDTSSSRSSLTAKTVSLQFPEHTGEGSTIRNIHVPLITLIPVSMSQVAEVKVRAKLELQLENDELMVSFPTVKSSIESNEFHDQGTSIEITLSPQQSSEGLKRLIDGYEKLLKSQIP